MTIVRILLLLSLPLFASAQVDLYFNALFGQMDENTLTDVDVSHFHQMELDVIYHAKVLSEKQNVLYEVQSGIIRTHEFGRKKLDVHGPKGFETLVEDTDLSRYSGKVYLMAELQHPVDRSSIIERIHDSLYLDKGLICDWNGTVRTSIDSLNVQWLMNYRSDVPFTLDSLFLVTFDNKNPVPITESFSFKIADSKKQILYESELNNISIPVGKSTLSPAQLKNLTVLKDAYKNRAPDAHLNANFGSKAKGNTFSRRITRFQHSEQPKGLAFYHNRSANYAFEFIDGSEFASESLPPDHFFHFFDKNGLAKNTQFLRPKHLPFALNDPYFVQVQRGDVDAAIRVSISLASDLSAAERKALFAQSLDKKTPDIGEKQLGNYHLLYPKKLFSLQERSHDEYVFAYEVGAFQVQYDDYVFHLNIQNYVAKEDEKQKAIQIDKLQCLNSFELNGHSFLFELDAAGFVKNVQEDKAQKTIELPITEWKHRLLASNKIAQDFIEKKVNGLPSESRLDDAFFNSAYKTLETAPFPKQNVIVEGGRDSRIFKKKDLDNLGISFEYRFQKGLKEEVSTLDLKYIMNDTMGIFGQIFDGGHATSGKYKGDTTQMRATVSEYTLGTHDYEIAVDQRHFYRGADMRTVRNISEFWLYGAEKMEKQLDEWTYLGMNQLGNTRYSSSFRFAFFLKKGKDVYGFRFITPMPADIFHILDTLEIGGQRFDFVFDKEKLIDLKIKK